MEHVIYDGVDLSERFTVAGVTRPLPTPTPTYQLVSGGNRHFVRGIELVPPTLSFRVISRELDEVGRRDDIRYLASVLLVDEPVYVEFSSDDGKRYLAVPSGELDFHEYVRCGSMEVTLMATEAAMYGREVMRQSTDGSVSFTVNGNYPTTLRIESTNARRESNSEYRFGYMLDNGAIEYVEIGTSAASSVIMDGESRSVTVNGAVAQLTLQSTWYEVKPGRHTLRRTLGSGEFKVSWVERWL